MMSLASASLASPINGADAMALKGDLAEADTADSGAAFGAMLTQSMQLALTEKNQPALLNNDPLPPQEDTEQDNPSLAVQDLLMLIPVIHAPITASHPPKITTLNADTLPVLDDDATRANERTAGALGLAHAEQISAAESHPMSESVGMTAPLRAAAEFSAPPQKQSLPLYSPVGSSAWHQEFSHQIRWMTRNDLHSASLSLNPPALGPVRVELQLTGTEAMVSFSSPVPEVRQAIEAAMPELKSLLEASGVNLASASVDQDIRHPHAGGDKERRAPSHAPQSDGNRTSEHVTEPAGSPPAAHINTHQLLDLYA